MHPLNQRKRKLDSVDDHHHNDNPESAAQDSPAVVAANPHNTHPPTWSQEVAARLPSGKCAKRPRIDTLHATTSPFHRTSATMFSPLRTPSDIEDIGIVVTNSDPGPSSGSLLRERPCPPPVKKPPATPTTPVVNSLQPDYSSPHIPSTTPLINRQTLRELDLDVIIRNPMLRALFLSLLLVPCFNV